MVSVLVSPQPFVHLYTVEPSFSQVAGVVVSTAQLWLSAGMVSVLVVPQVVHL